MADTRLIKLYLNAPLPNLNWSRRMAMRAQAYYDLSPYPIFGFQEWKTEERGPLPKCMPFCSNIVRRSANWLFGKPPRITCENEKVDDTILKEFKKQYPKLEKAVTTSLIEGSVTLRYSFNTQTKEGNFSFLSTLDNVRFVYDPHDADKVIVAYVQYPVYNPDTTKWEMYREAWTEDTYAVFYPVEITFEKVKFGENMYYGNVAFVNTTSGRQTAENFQGWEIDESKTGTNPLGFIPLTQIRNAENDTVYGEGILWPVTPIIDRINLAYHLMDRSNQFDSDPTLIYIDADLDATDVSATAPGGVQAIQTRESADGGNRQAKAQLIEPSGRLREHMAGYVSDLREQVCNLTGTVEISSKEVSNKGNFTQSVLNQIYAQLIESTDRRRSVWGTKIEQFLDKCAEATSKFLGYSWSEDDKFIVSWPEYFMLPEQEKGLKLDRLIKEEGLGLMTKSRIIQEVASMDGIQDVDEFIEELKNYTPEYEEHLDTAKNDASLETPPAESRQQSKEKSKTDKILS